MAVTHVLSTIILLDIYRDYFLKNRKAFSLHTLFVAGIGALLPDVDIPINWVLGYMRFSPDIMAHGGLTHTPFFALFFLVPGLWLWRQRKVKNMHRYAFYFLAIAFGILMHLLLDFVIGGGAYEGVMWLFPFSLEAWKLHLLNYINVPNIPAALDAVLLMLWLWHEEYKHKISDFI